MQPVLLKYVTSPEGSFKVWKNSGPYIHNPWHFHPEYEVTLIEKGTGTRFVGDNIEAYHNNDLIILGPYLPHEWRSHNNLGNGSDNYSSSLAIHFPKNFPGEKIVETKEASSLKIFLERAKLGLKITDEKIISETKEILGNMLGQTGLDLFSSYFKMTYILSECNTFEYLSSEGFVRDINHVNDKIDRVQKYVITNFRNAVSLKEVADHINMTPTSFCRFFKRSTHKTFVSYLAEIRIGYSKKLLQEDKLSITQAAFECGYNNLSTFNKQFKSICEVTPKDYRKNFRTT